MLDEASRDNVLATRFSAQPDSGATPSSHCISGSYHWGHSLRCSSLRVQGQLEKPRRFGPNRFHSAMSDSALVAQARGRRRTINTHVPARLT
jgi:hypothetical protein